MLLFTSLIRGCGQIQGPDPAFYALREKFYVGIGVICGPEGILDLFVAELDEQIGQPCRRRIVAATVDARLLSLDAADGKLCDDFGDHGVVDLRIGLRNAPNSRSEYEETSPPAVIPIGRNRPMSRRISRGSPRGAPSSMGNSHRSIVPLRSLPYTIRRPSGDHAGHPSKAG